METGERNNIVYTIVYTAILGIVTVLLCWSLHMSGERKGYERGYWRGLTQSDQPELVAAAIIDSIKYYDEIWLEADEDVTRSGDTIFIWRTKKLANVYWHDEVENRGGYFTVFPASERKIGTFLNP